MAKGLDSQVVIDTCVVLDIMIASRPRHDDAKQLGAFLIGRGIKPLMPMHGMFEVMCAVQNTVMQAPHQGTPVVTEDAPLKLEPVPIDNSFMAAYLPICSSIPYMKAGDLIFVALAKTRSAVFVTEDIPNYDKARAAGVEAYTVSEFLAEYAG